MDYRNILKEELARRCQTNARYSQRAFARDLGLSSARLSEVLAGRYGLSPTAAQAIAKQLGFNKSEIQNFVDLVESQHGRSKLARSAAATRLASRSEPNRLQIDAFAAVSEWYHFTLLELIELKDFKNDPKWMAARLGIHQTQVELAIERLKRLGFIEERNGALIALEGTTFSPDGTPSDAIKKFHKQVLEKAIAALQLQSLDEREFGASILAIDKKKIPEAKKAIKQFRREFCTQVASSTSKNEVYCLAVQFFNLTPIQKENRK